MNKKNFARKPRISIPAFRKSGFTLVELLVTTAIIGVLIGMLMPAAQAVREAARLTLCKNNLKNLGLATLNYESAKRSFPHGATYLTEHSWGTTILPFLEQSPTFNRIDLNERWDFPGGNRETSERVLPAFVCPSSDKDFAGRTDYCGISGSWRTTVSVPKHEHNGLFFPAYAKSSKPVRLEMIVDGTSHTLLISEGSEVHEDNFGFWACGLNCFSHEEGGVNAVERPAGEIVSDHPAGANGVFCDGSVRFLHNGAGVEEISALCTRNGLEVVNEF